MFVPLVDYDYVNGEVIPAGATSWSVSTDGKIWTFEIRMGWNWSNGEPVTAEDYVYAFQSIADPKTRAPMASRISIIENAVVIGLGREPVESLGVESISEWTLEIRLSEPAAWFLTSLTSIGHAVPKDTRERLGPNWIRPGNIVVNGPYIIAEWVQDDMLVLEKNPSYYDAGRVDIDRINLIVVPEASTAMAMYENNELDSVEVPPQDLDRIKEDAVLSKEFYNGPRFVLYYYLFNAYKPPMDDVLVRKAFAAATDKKTITEKITRGGQVPAPTLTPPGCFGHVPPSEGIGIPFDPPRARDYLADAGYLGGEGIPAVTLGYNANEINERIARAIAKMWENNLGVSVILTAGGRGGYNQAAMSGAFHIWRMGWGMDYPDAHNIHAEILHSSIGHESIIDIPEYDNAIDTAAVEMVPYNRYQLYKQAEKLMVEEHVGAIPIYWYAVNRVTKQRISRPDTPSFSQRWWLWSAKD
jgi:oligopeptide transport system substrate-binding protein